MLEVGRSKQPDLMLGRKCGDHDPLVASFVPKHFWVPKIPQMKVDDRVTRVLDPGTAVVITVGKVLSLQRAGVSRIDGDET